MFEAKNRVFEFDYQNMNTFESIQCLKNDGQVCLMCNLVNLVKVPLGSMSVLLSQKYGVLVLTPTDENVHGRLKFKKMMF